MLAVALRQPHDRVTKPPESSLVHGRELSDCILLVPSAKRGGRPAKYLKRETLNAIFYVVRHGASGACCLMTFRPGNWSIMIFDSGSRTAPGNVSRPCSGVMCAWPLPHNASQARA